MDIPHPIPPELAEIVATRLKVIGDPTRIRLLDAMRHGERSVSELVETLGTKQQNTSNHLGVLANAGIVHRRREATSAYYSIADDTVFALCELVCGRIVAQAEALSSIVEAAERTQQAAR